MNRSFGLRAICLCTVGLSALTAMAAAQAQELNIPAEDMHSALDTYIRQSGVQLVYAVNDVDGLKSNAVVGRYAPGAALDMLVQGTQLAVNRDPGGAMIVSRRVMVDPPGGGGGSAGPGPVETVVVTGSRVITDVANSPTPVTAVSPNQLLTTTPTTIADALNKLPQFQGSSSGRTAGGASSNGGGEFLNLRNFGQQRTLVMVDGMRVPSSNANGSVDVSTLPQMLVSRVDVVTGGGSAVYGSDAITGVVNFILDKNFTGIKYQANTGLSTYGDGLSLNAGVAAGTSLFGGRGHIEGELDWYHRDEVLKENRPQGDWSSYGDGSAASPITNVQHGRLNIEGVNGLIKCTNCSVNGEQFIANDVIGPFDYGIQTPSGSLSQGGDGGWWSVGSALAAEKRATGFGRFSYDLNDDTVFFAQFTGAESRVFSHFIPSQVDSQRQTINYFKNNPYLSAADRVALGDDSATDPNWATDGTNTFQVLMWVNPHTEPGDQTRRTNSTTRNLTFTTGFSGQVFGNYDWNFHYTHGESRDSVKGINNGNNQYHDAQQDTVIENGQIMCYNDTPEAIALYGNLYPGCVPMNPFGPSSISEEAYHYWSRTTKFAMTNKMDDIAGDISGNIFDLPAGPVRVALSGEMRWLGYTIKSNASPTQLVDCTGLRLCGNAAGTGPVDQSTVTQTYWDNNTLANVQADENVWEFSAEANIPILKNLPLIQDLSTDIAGRYTDYSTSGSAETWKVGLDWRVNDDVRIRGTTSVDIRAPTLNDLYLPTTSTSIGYFDLLTSYGNGLEQVSQGNPNLVPEVSRTYTAGIVYTPSYIPGLTVSADFYNINLKNAIGTVAGSNTQVQGICNASGGTSPYCALYVRPYPYTNTTPANYPTLIYSEELNSAFQSTEGEDYEVDYNFDMADIDNDLAGLVSLRGLLNIQPKIDARTFPGAEITHGYSAGSTTPVQKGHGTLFASYTLGNWSVNYQLTWFSDEWKNALLATPQYFAQPRVPSFNTSDITITKNVNFGDDSAAQLYVSVQNIANAIAPVVTGSTANPGVGIPVPQGEDVMGRYFTIGIRGNL